MKIESSGKLTGGVAVDRTSGRPAPKPASGKQTDGVHLSGLSAQLQASGDTPIFDSARVAEIKQAIADGKFSVNAGAVADRLISAAKDLVNSQRQA